MDERWEKVRAIVREECERIEVRILEAVEKGLRKSPSVKFENGRWTGITGEQVAAWKDAYGSCDVEAELKKMTAWIVSNPSQGPKSNYGRFINAWLAKQQNFSSIRAIPMRSELPEKKTCAYCPKPMTGSVGSISYCNDHSRNAMDREPAVKVA